jgi:NAD-dependent SIR2 family protein deacetylase
MDVQIPDDLVALVAERRVIPFIGAGFSAALDLPDWASLLGRLAEETEGVLP